MGNVIRSVVLKSQRKRKVTTTRDETPTQMQCVSFARMCAQRKPTEQIKAALARVNVCQRFKFLTAGRGRTDGRRVSPSNRQSDLLFSFELILLVFVSAVFREAAPYKHTRPKPLQMLERIRNRHTHTLEIYAKILVLW